MDEMHREYSLSEQEERHCRICLETEGELIIPCDCKTNPIHRTCLDRWRAEVKDGKNFSRCEICHFVYETEPVLLFPTPFIKRQYTLYVFNIMWVIFKALVILVGGISFWSVVCGFLDKKREMLLVFSLSPSQSYLLWGVILFFLTVDLYGIYYVLTNDEWNNNNGCNGCNTCWIDFGGWK